MPEDFDASFFDEDCLMPRPAPILQVQGACRSPDVRARLFLKTRLHMVMKLRNCSFMEAFRFIKQHDASEKEKDNG